MIDREGFRSGVGIILLNSQNQVFFGRRIGTNNWQFPQGGIEKNESLRESLFRELHEELGLKSEQVKIIAKTEKWSRYLVPEKYINNKIRNYYKGQKQIWFLLKFLAFDYQLNLRATGNPEFDAWRWSDYFVPLDFVVEFKHQVYNEVLNELNCYLPKKFKNKNLLKFRNAYSSRI